MDAGVSKQTVKPLFETVKNLCNAVAILTNNMNHMMETVGQLNINPVNPIQSEDLKLAIRQELKAMKEREKRIIVKGLEVPSGREFVKVFQDFWKYISGPDKNFPFSDIVCINRDKKLHVGDCILMLKNAAFELRHDISLLSKD